MILPMIHFASFLSHWRRSTCDDFERFFGDVGSVSKIELDTFTVECPFDGDGELFEVFVERDKTLTITSTEFFAR